MKNLNWKKHVSILSSKLRRANGLISSLAVNVNGRGLMTS